MVIDITHFHKINQICKVCNHEEEIIASIYCTNKPILRCFSRLFSTTKRRKLTIIDLLIYTFKIGKLFVRLYSSESETYSPCPKEVYKEQLSYMLDRV